MSQTRLINTERLKNEISEALLISEIASEICDVELVQSGTQWKGSCPIHSERTPSFHVSDSNGFYHCFGCGAGGDWIDLVQKVKHLEFFETLYFLAKESGIDISQYERPLTQDEKIEEGVRTKAEGWIKTLPLAKGRGGDALAVYGIREGHGQSLDLPTIQSFHQKGVIFPLRTHSGKLVGWRARQPDKTMFATPKDFAIHEATFFGLDIAREFIRESGEIIVVEGEYDVLALHNVGIKNVVSIGGSAFTDQHMEILLRLKVRKAVFLMDGDKGGRGAAKKIAERWWKGNVRCFIAELPDGKDPDDIAGESGATFLQILIDQAKWVLEYRLWIQWQEQTKTLSGKLEFLEWITKDYGPLLTTAEETMVAQMVAKWIDLPEARVLDFQLVNKSTLHDVESESVVIGRCIRDMNYYQAIRAKLVTTDFYLVRNQRIWTVLEEMMIENLDWDIHVAQRKTVAIGVDDDHFKSVVEAGQTNMKYHEDRVADMATRRMAKEEADKFRERVSDLTIPANESIGGLTLGVTRKSLTGSQGFNTIVDQVDSAMETLHERAKNPDAIHGISLGDQFPALNRRLQGIQKKRLVLVAAMSGAGKTTITIQWSVNFAVHQSIPTDYISLEMDEDELIFKMSSHLTGIDAEDITAGRLEAPQLKLVEKAMMRIKKSPLRIYAPDTITPSEFVLYARESVMDRRTEVFFLDYIQMASPDPDMSKKRTDEQLKEFGRVAKTQIARAMDVAVIAPAQLRRAAADSERPTKEDMGDSYDLSRTADVVIILKGNEDSDTVDLWLDKNRQGSGGHLFPTMFAKKEQSFYEQGGAKEPSYRLIA